VLEDSGNENEIYGLNFENGTIEKITRNTTISIGKTLLKTKTVISMLEILVTMIMNESLCIYKIDKVFNYKTPFQPTKFPLHILSKKIFLLKKQKCFMMLKDFSIQK
jgi:hypothetical protein